MDKQWEIYLKSWKNIMSSTTLRNERHKNIISQPILLRINQSQLLWRWTSYEYHCVPAGQRPLHKRNIITKLNYIILTKLNRYVESKDLYLSFHLWKLTAKKKNKLWINEFDCNVIKSFSSLLTYKVTQ